MQNNIFYLIFVPEITLAILAIFSLMYGLFLKSNSFSKTVNFATLALFFITTLIYFDIGTSFAQFNSFF